MRISFDVGTWRVWDSVRDGAGTGSLGRGSGRVGTGAGADGMARGRFNVAARTGTDGRGRDFGFRGGGKGADVLTRRGTLGKGRVRFRSSLIDDDEWDKSRKDVGSGYCDRASGIYGLEGAEHCGVAGRGWNDQVEEDADELVELEEDME